MVLPRRHPGMLAPLPFELAQRTTALIILNKVIKDAMKIVKALEDSGLIIKDARYTIEKEAKEQKGGLFNMLLGTLGAS